MLNAHIQQFRLLRKNEKKLKIVKIIVDKFRIFYYYIVGGERYTIETARIVMGKEHNYIKKIPTPTGKAFYGLDSDNQWWYVSEKHGRKRAYERVCPDCGKIDIVYKLDLDRLCASCAKSGENSFFYGKQLSQEHKDKISKANSGENHHNWKGGWQKHKDGYVRVWMPDHPNACSRGYVLEHVVVMEKHLGRYLTSEEVVHHTDLVRYNNVIENLWLFKNQAAHFSFHNMNNTSLSLDYREKKKKCKLCGKTLYIDSMVFAKIYNSGSKAFYQCYPVCCL